MGVISELIGSNFLKTKPDFDTGIVTYSANVDIDLPFNLNDNSNYLIFATIRYTGTTTISTAPVGIWKIFQNNKIRENYSSAYDGFMIKIWRID